ncbi:MAG: rhodanese-related sulfurtransferase [Patescibacteria group bacterium]
MKKKNLLHKLRNHLSKEEALKRLEQEDFKRIVVSFYRYVLISDPKELRNELFSEWSALGCFGRIYLSTEGINAQMSVPEPKWQEFQEKLYARKEFKDVPFKVGVEQKNDAFWKLTIKVRHQIVADGLKKEEYDVTNVGTHLTAKEWNELSLNPDTVVVDMRNNYESAIGRFEGAITPDAYTFKEELPMVKEQLAGNEEKKVLLYCTGGIRCEKASAYLKHHGFKDVNQLHGGIIDYKHQIEREGLSSQFKGKNFVFDERIGERITDDVLGKCYQCNEACDEYTNCANVACNLLFIQCKACAEKFSGACSAECQSIVHLSEAEQKEYRKTRGNEKVHEPYQKKIALSRA